MVAGKKRDAVSENAEGGEGGVGIGIGVGVERTEKVGSGRRTCRDSAPFPPAGLVLRFLGARAKKERLESFRSPLDGWAEG